MLTERNCRDDEAPRLHRFDSFAPKPAPHERCSDRNLEKKPEKA
jgi:hypothetical protein